MPNWETFSHVSTPWTVLCLCFDILTWRYWVQAFYSVYTRMQKYFLKRTVAMSYINELIDLIFVGS